MDLLVNRKGCSYFNKTSSNKILQRNLLLAIPSFVAIFFQPCRNYQGAWPIFQNKIFFYTLYYLGNELGDLMTSTFCLKFDSHQRNRHKEKIRLLYLMSFNYVDVYVRADVLTVFLCYAYGWQSRYPGFTYYITTATIWENIITLEDFHANGLQGSFYQTTSFC